MSRLRAAAIAALIDAGEPADAVFEMAATNYQGAIAFLRDLAVAIAEIHVVGFVEEVPPVDAVIVSEMIDDALHVTPQFIMSCGTAEDLGARALEPARVVNTGTRLELSAKAAATATTATPIQRARIR